jgi:hypothetical protein
VQSNLRGFLAESAARCAGALAHVDIGLITNRYPPSGSGVRNREGGCQSVNINNLYINIYLAGTRSGDGRTRHGC